MHTQFFFSFVIYMEELQLSISPAQMKKIQKGLPIQISHGSMGSGDVVISLRPEKAKKMVSAYKRGKDCEFKWTKMKYAQVDCLVI